MNFDKPKRVAEQFQKVFVEQKLELLKKKTVVPSIGFQVNNLSNEIYWKKVKNRQATHKATKKK